MAQAFTEKIDAVLAESSVLDELPAEIEGFVLSKERQVSEGQYDFFCYDHAAKHRAVVGFYDASTASYKLRVEIGVVSFALPSFIYGDFVTFGRELTRNLPRVMAGKVSKNGRTGRSCRRKLRAIRSLFVRLRLQSSRTVPSSLLTMWIFRGEMTSASITTVIAMSSSASIMRRGCRM